MENALQFLDELKDMYKHQIEQAIDEWDYLSFPPDMRRALLDQEIGGNDVSDDLKPEVNAIQSIHEPNTMNWQGLSQDAELANYDCGVVLSAETAALDYESKMVLVCTPPGGIQGIPAADAMKRFLVKANKMDPAKVAHALVSRLNDTTVSSKCWQVRSKVLVLMEILMESAPLVALYSPAFLAHATLVRDVDQLRCNDRNHLVRMNARKVLSLLESHGGNVVLMSEEPKSHVRLDHSKIKKKSAAPDDKRKFSRNTSPSAVVNSSHSPKKNTKPAAVIAKANSTVTTAYQPISPKIAKAALASWKRRANTGQSGIKKDDNPNMIPFQNQATAVISTKQDSFQNIAPVPVMSITTTGAINTRTSSSSGQRSAFSFIN